jgi:hypothetical protein
MLGKDTSDTLILAGSGRSGTTWIGNIIAANPKVRVIFEPFDYRRVPEASVLPLRAYARQGEAYPQWEVFVRRVLLGDIHNDWVNRQGKRWWATKRLVKTIRANLMLGWVSEVFRSCTVFIIRHPCAVVLSRLRLEWDTHLDVFLAQPQLIADYLEPFVDMIRAARTPVQQHAMMWCVENLVPLLQLSDNADWVFCTYEELYCRPEAETERILNHLRLRKTWFTRRAIKRVTMVTRPESALVLKRNPLIEWQQQLSTRDIDTILSIVEAFGIQLYSEDVMPDLSKL